MNPRHIPCAVLIFLSLLGPSAYAAAGDANRLHAALLTTLRQSHAATEGSVWFDRLASFDDGWILATPGAPGLSAQACQAGTAGCDGDFALKSCRSDSDCGAQAGSCRTVHATVKRPGETPKNLCAGGGDFMVDRVYDLITSAHTTVDIVSLSLPTGRFRTAIQNALIYLSTSGLKPRVRLLFGGADSMDPNVFVSPDSALTALLAPVRAAEPGFALPVTLGWLSALPLSWNHAKIVAVDGRAAIVGGENLWQEDYLDADPVYDLSIAYSGEAAAAPRTFADTLWQQPAVKLASFPAGSAADVAAAATADDKTGSTSVLVVGRLGTLGDAPSDDALTALIDHAQHTIRLSQQDFYNRTTFSIGESFAADALARAMLRGVDVQIIKSGTKDGGYNMISVADTHQALLKHTLAAAKAAGQDEAAVRPVICGHLHVAPLKIPGAVPSMPLPRNHAKVVLVDDAAFYVGSQNLYPANLQEIGTLVFDETLATELVQKYWDPIWQASETAEEPCGG